MIAPLVEQFRSGQWKRELKRQAAFLALVLGLLWGLALATTLIPGLDRLKLLGVRPRSLVGLAGLLFAPWLHHTVRHVAANTLPFFLLGGLVLLRGRKLFWQVTATAALTGGAVAWLIGGENTVHLGSSGLIFGYFGYLLARAYFERSSSALLIAAVVGLSYGGLLWSLVGSTDPELSWEMHLGGILGGTAAAWVLSQRAPPSEVLRTAAQVSAATLWQSRKSWRTWLRDGKAWVAATIADRPLDDDAQAEQASPEPANDPFAELALDARPARRRAKGTTGRSRSTSPDAGAKSPRKRKPRGDDASRSPPEDATPPTKPRKRRKKTPPNDAEDSQDLA